MSEPFFITDTGTRRLVDIFREEGREWAVELGRDGRSLWQMVWAPMGLFTEQPAAAKAYTEQGARNVETRLKKILPGCDLPGLRVVRHPLLEREVVEPSSLEIPRFLRRFDD